MLGQRYELKNGISVKVVDRCYDIPLLKSLELLLATSTVQEQVMYFSIDYIPRIVFDHICIDHIFNDKMVNNSPMMADQKLCWIACWDLQ